MQYTFPCPQMTGSAPAQLTLVHIIIMIRIAKQLSRTTIKDRLMPYPPAYRFSDSPKDRPDEPSTGLSVYDVFKATRDYGMRGYEFMKRWNWYHWAGIGMLGIFTYYISSGEAEYYPINTFEQEISCFDKQQQSNLMNNKNIFSNMKIVINISTKGVTYKVKFSRNDRDYIVNYYDEVDRFKAVQRIIDQNSDVFNHTYEYVPNIDVSTFKLYVFFHIVSIVFCTLFFLRSSRLSSVRKGGTSSSLTDMFQKTSFEVVAKTNVKFKDVAGLDQSKVEIQEFVDFLKNPQKYKKLGARIPKGVLLSGPPGTGKTMLAKACAGEAGVPFVATSGSDFVEIFVGVGASRVRDLFKLAREKSPSIIFIDEIDAVGRKRSGSHGSHDERDNTLNQILVEMDGFGTDSNVIVMAATNRQNLLDTALIRPGRFDRMVEVNLPDLEGRRQIFNVHLSKITLEAVRTQDEYARRLATLTPGFSGAQIANLCNEAAILAARHGKVAVDSHDIEMATERIIGGVERKSIMSKDEKKIVSVHESGHAVVSWFLKGADPLLKLTIIPRSKGSLGFAQYFVNQTKLNTKSQLLDRICFILGGRCAEEHFFGKVTNGASDDLKKAYQLAHNIVVKLGMNDEIGYIGYKDPQYFRPYSDKIGEQVDTQIRKIIADCTEITRQMVRDHEKHIKQLSDELFEKETLTIKQIRRILGERDFTSNETYEKYLQIEKELGLPEGERIVVPQSEVKPAS